MHHEDIRIPFTLVNEDGTKHEFEAVGFIKAGEQEVVGAVALRRVDNGNLVRNDADRQLVYANRKQLPAELQPYWLSVAVGHAEDTRFGSTFACYQGVWTEYWLLTSALGNLGWDRRSLVLRRVAA